MDRRGCSPHRRRCRRLGFFVSAAVVGDILVADVAAAGAVASVEVVRVAVLVIDNVAVAAPVLHRGWSCRPSVARSIAVRSR